MVYYVVGIAGLLEPVPKGESCSSHADIHASLLFSEIKECKDALPSCTGRYKNLKTIFFAYHYG